MCRRIPQRRSARFICITSSYAALELHLKLQFYHILRESSIIHAGTGNNQGRLVVVRSMLMLMENKHSSWFMNIFNNSLEIACAFEEQQHNACRKSIV